MEITGTGLNIILTGATGMVGEGVLHECIYHPAVDSVLLIVRKPSGILHPKVKEVIHSDFSDVSAIEHHMSGYNACFFCMGVSSVGMSEEDYFPLTYTLTINFAKSLSRINKHITFCYISGAGTDSSEKGRLMWARVKGKTENHLMKLPFDAVYNFRPAVLSPTRGLKNTLKPYRYLGWLIPVVKKISPKYICSLKELGLAMINVSLYGHTEHIIEVPDIISLSKYQPGHELLAS